jgi:hypothetical protein
VNCNNALTVVGLQSCAHLNTNGARNLLPRLRVFVSSAGRCQDGTVTAFCIVRSSVSSVVSSKVSGSHVSHVVSSSDYVPLLFFVIYFWGECYCTVDFSYCCTELHSCY